MVDKTKIEWTEATLEVTGGCRECSDGKVSKNMSEWPKGLRIREYPK